MTVALARKSAVDILTEHKEQFLAAVPKDIDRQRFFAIAVSILKDDKLAACTERSKIDSIYRFARLGFDPDPLLGEGYVIPRNCKRRVNDNGQWKDLWENLACFQPGYRGLMKLARKSRTIAEIHAEVVYEGEPFKVYKGTHRRIEHEPWYSCGMAQPSSIKGAYATWKDLATGCVEFHVITSDRIERAKRMNKDKAGNPSKVWQDDEAAMARKTAIIDASKFWQLSAELAEAVDAEERIERGEPLPVVPNTIIVEAQEEDERSELDDFMESSEQTGAGVVSAPAAVEGTVEDAPLIPPDATDPRTNEQIAEEYAMNVPVKELVDWLLKITPKTRDAAKKIVGVESFEGNHDAIRQVAYQAKLLVLNGKGK